MPNHLECCTKKIFDFIAENLGRSALVNIMAQYRPEYNAYKYKEIAKSLGMKEFQKAVDYAEDIGLNFIT